MSDLMELFKQCIKPETPPKAYEKDFTLTESDILTILDFHRMGDIYGITIDKIRYITDGAWIISSFAIASSAYWGVFHLLFEKLGDSWYLARWSSVAKPESISSNMEFVKAAIEKWSEGLDELNFLVSIETAALFKNSKNQLIAVWPDYLRFIQDLDFSLNDTTDPLDPITLTHNASLGFAGVLMPMKLQERANKAAIEALETALNLLKGE